MNVKPIEFDGFKQQAGLNSFSLTAKQWIEKTSAIGLVSKSGRYGGTYAHKDIAFELSEYEYGFYTAIANNDSARKVMEKDELRELAVVLYEKVKENASIDWTIKESVKAKLKVIVKRILRKYGYQPDMQMLATDTVLKQAELIAEELAQGK